MGEGILRSTSRPTLPFYNPETVDGHRFADENWLPQNPLSFLPCKTLRALCVSALSLPCCRETVTLLVLIHTSDSNKEQGPTTFLLFPCCFHQSRPLPWGPRLQMVPGVSRAISPTSFWLSFSAAHDCCPPQ